MRTYLLILVLLTTQAQAAKISAADTAPFNILGVALLKDSYDDAVKKLGPTNLNKSGTTNHDKQVDFCYAGKDGTEVKFEQGFSQGFEIITRYTVKAGVARASCSVIDAIDSSLAPRNGLRLGMEKAQVQVLLGNPKEKKNKRWKYFFEEYETYSAEKSAEVSKTTSTGFKYKGEYHYLSVDISFDSKGKTNAISVQFSGEQNW